MKDRTQRWIGFALCTLLFFTVMTGLLLQAYHGPTLEEAPRTYLMLRTRVFLGDALIAVHFWSAHLLLLLAGVHLLEKGWGRRFLETPVQWLVGWGLLGLLVLADLTGHLLPVHREGYWTYTRSMEVLRMIPGVRAFLGLILGWQDGVSSLTYIRSYAFHVTVFVLLFLPLGVWHVARWWKQQVHPSSLWRWRVLEIGVLAAAVLASIGYLFPVVAHRLTDPLHPPEGATAVWALRPSYGMSRVLPESMSALLYLAGVAYLMVLPFLPQRAAGKSRRVTLLGVLLVFVVFAWIGGRG